MDKRLASNDASVAYPKIDVLSWEAMHGAHLAALDSAMAEAAR